jgi:Lar family restriction alleviation protein
MSEPVALLPCPFCGHNEIAWHEGDGKKQAPYYLECVACFGTMGGDTRDSAMMFWNRRTHPPSERVRELVEALRPFARIDVDKRGALMPDEYVNWEDWAEDVLRARAAIAAEGLKEGGS